MGNYFSATQTIKLSRGILSAEVHPMAPPRLNRRQVLAGTGIALTTVLLAGCADPEEPEDFPEEDDEIPSAGS